jgi:hypothetical protein
MTYPSSPTPTTASCMAHDVVTEVAPFSLQEKEGEDAAVAAVRPSGGSAQWPAGDGILEWHLWSRLLGINWSLLILEFSTLIFPFCS